MEDGVAVQLDVPYEARSGVVAVDAGTYHVVALKGDGSVIAWGSNPEGAATVPESAASGVVAVFAGTHHTVALKDDGSVIVWGDNAWGQADVPESASSGVIAIAAGADHTVALKSDGTVVAWGADHSGQLTLPESVASGVIAVAAYGYKSAALTRDGTVHCWGGLGWNWCAPSAPPPMIDVARNAWDGFLGLEEDGDLRFTSLDTPPPPPAASSGVVAIDAMSHEYAVLKSDGSVFAWGRRNCGMDDIPRPRFVLEPSGEVPAGDVVRFSDGRSVVNCAWDGATPSGTCQSAEQLLGVAAQAPAYAGLNYRALVETKEEWPPVGTSNDLYFGGTAYDNRGGVCAQAKSLVEIDGQSEMKWLEPPQPTTDLLKVRRLNRHGTLIDQSAVYTVRLNEAKPVVVAEA